jgi:hypothetical protein
VSVALTVEAAAPLRRGGAAAGAAGGSPRPARRRKPPGTGRSVVYLLHFDRPYGPGGGANGRSTAGHYTGTTTNLPRRLREHARGEGARLIAVVQEAGIGWTLARTWPGGRDLERRLKKRGGASRRCPLCGVRPRPAPLPRNSDGSLSRSRTTDAQKDAAGVMTSVQLAEHSALRRGAASGRVPGLTRSTGPVPADDAWYAAPSPAEREPSPPGARRPARGLVGVGAAGP